MYFNYGTTFEPADEMNPGRELDRLVAERVMGWKLHSRNMVHYMRATGDEKRSRPVVDVREWSPSEDIADAWLVVEKLARRRYEVGVQTSDGRYTVLIARNGQASAAASAETAPHAICLAAIQAYGQKVEIG